MLVSFEDSTEDRRALVEVVLDRDALGRLLAAAGGAALVGVSEGVVVCVRVEDD